MSQLRYAYWLQGYELEDMGLHGVRRKSLLCKLLDKPGQFSRFPSGSSLAKMSHPHRKTLLCVGRPILPLSLNVCSVIILSHPFRKKNSLIGQHRSNYYF